MKQLITRLILRASGQCSICAGWFDDWNGGICDACRNTGRH